MVANEEYKLSNNVVKGVIIFNYLGKNGNKS